MGDTAIKPDPFPLRISAIFAAGIDGFRRQPLPLLAGGLLTLAVYAVFGIPSRIALDNGHHARGVALNLAGSVLAGAAAYPWFVYALRISREEKADLGEPFRNPAPFGAVLVCSFWFWAAFVLGYQYLSGLPSLVVLLFYAFYGFVIADGMTNSGIKALGISVRLSQGRRVALLAMVLLFAAFNTFVAGLPLIFGLNTATAIAAGVIFLVTSSVTMVSGAVLFDAYKKDLPDKLHLHPLGFSRRLVRRSGKRGRTGRA